MTRQSFFRAVWPRRTLGVVLVVAIAIVGLPLTALANPIATEDLTGPLTPEDLVETLVGAGVSFSNVTYTGAEVAAGRFSGGSGIIGLESGIILSTGDVANVIGPNSSESTGTPNGTEGDSDLDTLAEGSTLDAAVLEFDFVPTTSTLTIDYVFASDEYNEFVNTAFNDVFAFFVNGENCAVVNGDPVSINTINNGNPVGTEPNSHPELYINNDLVSGAALDTEMDGLTVVLTCEAAVNAGETNHVKLAIADTSDQIWDANVFLGAQTFEAALPEFNFFAFLDGEEETPPVATNGAGVFGASVNQDETILTFVVVNFNLANVVAAHIHCGDPGVAGPVGVTLFAGGPTSEDGILAQTSVTAPDEGNDCGWATLADVLDALRAGDTYVNVHTQANPGGEIRGQVQAEDIPAAPSGSFVDDDDNIHEGNIEAIADPGITKGCNPPANTEYCPASDITRGQMAAFLRRTFNLPFVETDHFVDDEDSEFEADINAIAEVGITIGCNPPDNTEFCPTDSVTRAQMASFIVRALALTEGMGDDLFVDDDTSVHELDIDALGTAGITLGCNPPDNDQYCPEDPVKRDQMASFFARFLEFREMHPV
ncbi:MAG: choice-of-anchor L domain-containing protein [Acidimicrobiia bacterium]